MVALKECPFCSGYRLQTHVLEPLEYPFVYWVECDTCGATGPVVPSETSAHKMWNGELVKKDPTARRGK